MTMLPFGDVAPIQRRAIAYIIDAAIGFGISFVIPMIAMIAFVSTGGDLLSALLIAGPLFSVLALAWFIVYTVMQAGNGSIGMRTQGIRLANALDGAPLGLGRTLLRNVIWGLAALIVVGYFTVLFDGSGRFQGWHDKVAGSVMLDQRALGRGAAPQFLDNTQPPLVPGDRRAASAPTSMPGFEVPPTPPTSMPGFTQAHPPVEDELVEHTVLSPRIHRDAPDYDLPDDPLISFVPGVTQEPFRRPVEPAPVEQAPVEPAPVEPATALSEPFTEPVAAPVEVPVVHPPAYLSEDDEVEDIESTRISVPGHRLVFTWDDGQRATVSGRTVFGRNPEEAGGVTNVAVRDETRSLSKTHFEAGANASGGWVMDRQSTNGTMVVRDGVRIACPPGQRVPIRLGDALEIGDRIVTIGGYV